MRLSSGELANMLHRPTITVEEAATVLSLGRSATYEAVRSGEIASIKIGNRIVIPTAPLRARLGMSEESEKYAAERKSHEATRAKLGAATKIAMTMAREIFLTVPTDPASRKAMRDLIDRILNEAEFGP